IRESRAEPGQVFLPRIRQDEALAIDQERREVADPGADFQDPRSDPGSDTIEHPGVVTDSAGETLQCLRANGIAGIYGVPLGSDSGFFSGTPPSYRLSLRYSVDGSMPRTSAARV